MNEKKAKTYYYVPAPVEGFNSEDFATSNISLNAENVGGTDPAGESYDGTKFTVACERLRVEGKTTEEISAALSERWNLDLQGALDVFYSAVFTRPNYKGAAKEEIEAGNWEEAHQLAQQAIDDYQFNVRKTRKTVDKATMQRISALEAKAQALGITADELLERIASMG